MSTSARPAGSERRRLAEEQAALRRVATLVAGGAPSSEVFEAVAREVAQVLHLGNASVGRYDDGTVMTVLASAGFYPETFHAGSRWPLDGPSMSREVLRTGRPLRVEDYDDLPGTLAAEARRQRFNRVAGAPIIVDGQVWGLVATSSPDAPFPDGLEDRLAEFTELVAMAIANSQAHEEIARLAEEQAALRRVATLVAAGAPPVEVFKAVSTEVAALIPSADGSALTRYEADGTVRPVSGWAADGGYTYAGRRYPLEGTVSGLIFETGRPGRVDDYSVAAGEAPQVARDLGWHSSVGAPITVDGRLWGVLAIASKSDEPLPSETERRLAEFTDLVATAIANSQAHEQLAQLADEQAALRRVATLAAQGAPPGEVAQAVSVEVAKLVHADGAGVTRYEDDGTFTALGGWMGGGDYLFTNRRFAFEGSLSGLIFETRCPARIDSFEDRPGEAAAAIREMGWRSMAGAPITVEGRLWGALVVYSKSDEPLPLGTEERVGEFSEIVATAIANAESLAELEASRARIVSTADATRRRIERDLHEGAHQKLVALALQVRAAQAAAPPELEQHRASLAEIADGMTNALEGLREIALGLHPAVLAEGGLEPALATLAHRSQIPAQLDVRLEGRLPEPAELAAYYVVSEAMTNAAKHAGASKVQVAVGRRDATLQVSVRDNGRGGADPDRGSGLLGLKDRAEAMGGKLSVESPPGTGTSLLVELPLDEPVADTR
jgi:signal transduction histidine kinase